MANGAFNFKNNSGNIVSFISGSGSDIIMSGGTLDLSGMTGLTLGNLTMEGTVETASFAPSYLLTSSFNSYTGTTDNIIGSLQTSTSSLNSFTSSADSRLDTIEGVTGSYATTGSNTFNGNLTVTGYIDAQELRTTYISSSILYRSGSTKFGDELTDTHAFTGSLLVSGGISGVGSFSATESSSFGSSVTATSFEVGNGQYFKARRTSSNLLIDLLGIESGTDNTRLLITGDLNIKNGSLSTLLNMTTTGVATFTGSLTANSLLVERSASRNMLGISTVSLPTSGDEEGVAVIKTNSTLWQLSTVGYAVDSKGVRFYNNGGAGYTAFEVAQAGGTRFIVNGVGNVGIGTNSPNSRLNIVGGTSNAGSTTTSDYSVVIQDPTSMVAGVGGSILLQGYKTSTSAIGNFAYVVGKKENGTAGNEAGYLALGTFDSAGIGFERMRIDSSGTVQVKSGNELRVYRSDNARYGTFYTDNLAVHIAASTDPIRISSPERTEFYTAGVERMRITSTGRVMIGGSSGTLDPVWEGMSVHGVNGSNKVIIGYLSSATNGAVIGSHVSNLDAWADLNYAANNHLFRAQQAIVMQITSGGDVLLGASSFPAGERMMIQKTEAAPLGLDRRGSDGGVLRFYHDGAEEGNVTVAGTTVSYNGGHLSRYSQTSTNTIIEGLVKGTVMSNLDQMAVWINPETDEPYPNEQLNCMKISDIEGDPNVAGVFVNWDNDGQTSTNDMNIAMTGDMIIRIAQGITVQRGNLLISAGDGTAKPQDDGIIRNSTIAKVTSTHVTCTYEDGSYCVPCVLMAC